MELATLTSPKVTFDVYPAAPSDLRSRLRAASATPAALLPGGMVLEESPEALVYRLAKPGVWRVAHEGDVLCLSNADGTTVRIEDGKLSLSIAK